MEAVGEDLEDDGDSAENNLLKDGTSPCVCCKVCDKDFVSGWTPSFSRKLTRKPTKAHALLGNARKERNLARVECGFVFRHYEKSEKYIEQYRENHCSTFLENEAEWKPVLGIDVPDPYLPKIANSSQSLLDRVKFIEAMSDYYKVAAMRSDLKNICLTGRRAETADRAMNLVRNSKLEDEKCLPFIVTSSNGTQVQQKEENRKRKSSSEETRVESVPNRQEIQTAPCSKQDCLLPSVPSKPDIPHVMKDNPLLKLAKDLPSNDSRRITKERIRLPKFQWTECHVKNHKRPSEKNPVAVKMEKKEKSSVEVSQSSDSDESVLAANRQSNSRGNLRLGTTVKSPASKTKQKHVAVGKCEVFSTTLPTGPERARRSYETTQKLPTETAFIRILGHQTGPPPKQDKLKANKGRPKTKDSTSARNMNRNLPLQYMTRFGRRQFHHVLEARSFKPGERKLGATAVAERN